MLEQFRRGLDGRREEASFRSVAEFAVARVDEKLTFRQVVGVFRRGQESGSKNCGRSLGWSWELERELELEPEVQRKVCVLAVLYGVRRPLLDAALFEFQDGQD
jgi:hypothetical protein